MVRLSSQASLQVRYHNLQKLFSWADFVILVLLAGVIYGVANFAAQWKGNFTPSVVIDLSLLSLPKYVLLSAGRGIAAYFISLSFALFYGYMAAKSPKIENVLILILDILQSIPVLGFLPGLVLGLISLFPESNIGLELAAVLMIFSSQAWNMCFSFHSSLKALPSDLNDVSRSVGLSWWSRLFKVELPFAAVGLAWNSLLSMAGGWFFLTICETFTLGPNRFRLPGLGSYMAVAIEQNNIAAMTYGVLAMTSLILLLDFVIWRPVLVWVQRFRVEQIDGADGSQSFVLQVFRDSRLLRLIQNRMKRSTGRHAKFRRWLIQLWPSEGTFQSSTLTPNVAKMPSKLKRKWYRRLFRISYFTLQGVIMALGVYAIMKLGVLLHGLSLKFWVILLRDTMWSLLRIFGALILATLWAVPVGVMIGLSSRATRIAQPIVQVIAAFPAPMLFPLVIAFMAKLQLSNEVTCMVLMMMGSQWYILFNVLAGATGISKDLRAQMRLTTDRRRTHWLRLYLPGIFPSLVVGWITAAGGFWNSAIVTEFVHHSQGIQKVNGLGATISVAAEEANFPALAGSLLMIVVVVVVMNRTLWQRLGEIAERRFQVERSV